MEERLTVVPEFHSHLEPMKRLRPEEMDDQITFSYINYNGVSNTLDLPGPFPVDADPTRQEKINGIFYVLDVAVITVLAACHSVKGNVV